MGIYEQVNERLKAAMKARDKELTTALRNIKAALLHGAKETGADTLPDEQSVELLRRLAKQRQESIDAYAAGGREDMAASERSELIVIEGFLPRLADEATTRAWVRDAIAQAGASSAKDLGKVMGLLMKAHKADLDAKLANQIIRDLLP